MKRVLFKRLLKEVVLKLVVSYWINWTFITSQLEPWCPSEHLPTN